MPLSQIVSASIEDGAVAPVDLSSVAQYYGFKNRIINGAMGIWQRGTSFASGIAAFTYTADRYFVYATGASVAVAQVAGSSGYKYALQITGAASNTSAAMYQRIESLNCIDLSGATITISVTLTASSTQTVGWSLQFPTASDNYASATIITGGTWTVGTTATTYTATATNLPAGVLNGMQLIIGANNFGAFTSGTLQITGVQLEKGVTATSFDYRPYTTELQLCQRYYTTVTSTVYTGSVNYPSYMWKVTMRATPTITGGGTGFASEILNADLIKPYQTTAAIQTMLASAEL